MADISVSGSEKAASALVKSATFAEYGRTRFVFLMSAVLFL
ncbi:hypothetical protein CES86_2312 [Brucella lupini]|uniref:Uncharacterized protein n=1 Tax=Brucella lupini TaxID=255457 RepID=A0A256GRY1_9HYPH|nr:hypothetical protein CES86_2312 [Brucella lupini]